jgi:hypothetical protein
MVKFRERYHILSVESAVAEVVSDWQNTIFFSDLVVNIPLL